MNQALTIFHADLPASVNFTLWLDGLEDHAAQRILQYFTAEIRNPHTRKAYFRALIHFVAWCNAKNLALRDLTPFHVAAYDLRGDENYAYDPSGNRTNSHLHGSGYQTGTGNRLSSDSTYTYLYDAEGNLLIRTEIATGKTRNFMWDHRNRLTSIEDKDNLGTVTQRLEYTYDAFDRRIRKSVDTTPNDGLDGLVMQFVYDREDVILDFVDADGSGPQASAVDRYYLHWPDIDQILAQEKPGQRTEWVFVDHLGSVRDIVTNDGLANHLHLDSLGKLLSQTNTLLDSRYMFTGREYDAESGLHYYRTRYLDSGAGRFLSEDGVGLAFSTNLHPYVNNSPVDFVDPTGEILQSLVGGIAGVLGGWALAGLTGECYSFDDALLDFGAGALGVGLINKAQKLARIRELRRLAESSGLKFQGGKNGVERWANGMERLQIKHKPASSSNIHKGSKRPRSSHRTGPGQYRDPFTGATGDKFSKAAHVPLEPGFTSPINAGVGALGGAAAQAGTSDCKCRD
jgi:RHS repeat-associated protein